MKHNIILAALALLMAGPAQAVPAHPAPARIAQPDGTYVTIRLLGDEYLHFNTTADGYSVVRRPDGYYAYATLDADGQLCATGPVAHDAAERTAVEKAWLQGVGKYLTPTMTATRAEERQQERARQQKARAAAAHREPLYDYNNFRGLLLLVQYNDCEFSRSDYAEVMNDMVNKPNYTGFGNSGTDRYTGSVRDYFYDNSDGQFAPQFDVVGPVTIDYSQYDAQGTQNATSLNLAAINAADSLVDYSQYDRDGDGIVDMVYFIYAGLGSNISGNDGRLLWPHRSIIYNPSGGRQGWWVERDGVAFYDYACSTELYGSANWSILDGIGVVCHEFGHVLGLPDLYDTDYADGGGQSNDPGDWCIMAGGAYHNYGRTPAGYSLYERYAVGFATPQLITDEGFYQLPSIGSSNSGYRLNTPVRREFFLIENRQKSDKWDRELAGSGMLVFRVDSTNNDVWEWNDVNANPRHNYFELLRAGGVNGGQSRASDPFPGTTHATMLNSYTQPANLLTWGGRECMLGFENIVQRGRTITFDIVDQNVLRTIALPRQLAIGCNLDLMLNPERYPQSAPCTLTWTSSNPAVATIDATGKVRARSVGQTVITAVANGDETISSSCTVTVVDQTIADNIADYKALGDQAEAALLLSDGLVVYVHDGKAYLRDATGVIIVDNDELHLEPGDQLNGSLYGRLAADGPICYLHTVDGLTIANTYTVEKELAVEPRQLSVADVTAEHYGDYVTLKATRMETGTQGLYARGGDNSIRLYNTFKLKNISVPRNYQGKFFDVTGILLTNELKDGTAIDELVLTESPKEVEAPTAIQALAAGRSQQPDAAVTIFTADGRRMGRATLATLGQMALPRGIYIVKTGNEAWRIVR